MCMARLSALTASFWQPSITPVRKDTASWYGMLPAARPSTTSPRSSEAFVSIAFSSKGNYLAYGGIDGSTVLTVPDFRRHSLVRFGNAGSPRFSPDDKLVAFVDKQFGAIR